mgnify:CR=1 FL=1
MSIKKKLGLGVASAALGLALVGGGTWAAFNDVERLNHSFATGTLDLEIEDVKLNKKPIPKTFELSNIKPGDQMVRAFKLKNNGTLAIREVLMNVSYSDFKNGKNEFVDEHKQKDNTAEEFLDQFKVEILLTGAENPNAQPRDNFYIIKPEDNKTLKDLIKMKDINLAPANKDEQWTGIPKIPDDYEIVVIAITMKDDKTKVNGGKADGEYVQNKYQGDSIKLNMTFEATQWEGLDINDTRNNGVLEKNKRSHSNTNPPTLPSNFDVQ